MLPTLSYLSVSIGPESRLRHWCSFRYLRISPLHRKFHFPLLHSSHTVSGAIVLLSRTISHLTYMAAYTSFTPSKSGQRLLPLYYRGCWHRVSRSFFLWYSQAIELFVYCTYSHSKGLYNPKAFIIHAASLRQTCVHCGRFPTAASRRSLGRFSVPV